MCPHCLALESIINVSLTLLAAVPPSAYPADSNAVTSVSVFRATPPAGLRHGGTFDVRMFERHACTTQAFIPMQRGEWLGEKELSYEAEMGKPGMIVLAALNGPGESSGTYLADHLKLIFSFSSAPDDKPDLATLKVFLTSPAQGVCYRAGVSSSRIRFPEMLISV